MLAPTAIPASTLIASLREIAHALSAAWGVDKIGRASCRERVYVLV